MAHLQNTKRRRDLLYRRRYRLFAHREIARLLQDCGNSLARELRRTVWHPNAPVELSVAVAAFAEALGEIGLDPTVAGRLGIATTATSI